MRLNVKLWGAALGYELLGLAHDARMGVVSLCASGLRVRLRKS